MHSPNRWTAALGEVIETLEDHVKYGLEDREIQGCVDELKRLHQTLKGDSGCYVCGRAPLDFGQRGDGPAQQDGETGRVYCSAVCMDKDHAEVSK